MGMHGRAFWAGRDRRYERRWPFRSVLKPFGKRRICLYRSAKSTSNEAIDSDVSVERQAKADACPFPIVILILDDDKIGRAHVELQSLMRISYAVFCLKKKTQLYQKTTIK